MPRPVPMKPKGEKIDTVSALLKLISSARGNKYTVKK